jgi:hypothetical protein
LNEYSFINVEREGAREIGLSLGTCYDENKNGLGPRPDGRR